jgi:hypothetical protein
MKTIISTQLPDQFKKLETLFKNKVELLNMPLIEIEPMPGTEDLLREIKSANSYNWADFYQHARNSMLFSLCLIKAVRKETLCKALDLPALETRQMKN